MLEPFLLDPDLMDDRTSDASTMSTDRANFRQRVIDRDGTCLMTGTGARYCQACHIIPHAKGHQVCSEYFLNHSEFSFQVRQYIEILANHRHQVLEPPLNDINDTRNGILLAVQLHASLWTSEVAFLQVSYFVPLSFMWLN